VTEREDETRERDNGEHRRQGGVDEKNRDGRARDRASRGGWRGGVALYNSAKGEGWISAGAKPLAFVVSGFV